MSESIERGDAVQYTTRDGVVGYGFCIIPHTHDCPGVLVGPYPWSKPDDDSTNIKDFLLLPIEKVCKISLPEQP